MQIETNNEITRPLKLSWSNVVFEYNPTTVIADQFWLDGNQSNVTKNRVHQITSDRG